MVTEKKLEEILNAIITTLSIHYQPDKVILFGSYAYGRPHPDSDLDLLIVKESSERPLDRRMAVRQLLRQTNFQIPLTLIVLTPTEVDKRVKMGDQFLHEILSKGKVLYARRGVTYSN